MINAKWIKPVEDFGDIAPVYRKSFATNGNIKNATLTITAMGVYEAELGGKRVGDFVLAPGWTAYRKRLQVQQYDVTDLISEANELRVAVGKGWYHTHLMDWEFNQPMMSEITETPLGLIAELKITYENGEEQTVKTDETWTVSEGPVRFSEIYDGEFYDARISPDQNREVECFDGPTHTLIPQQGEEIRKQEELIAREIIHAPNGELIIDFGQNFTGTIRTDVNANAGDVVDISFGEVLDSNGNFYNANYRRAKCNYNYICRDGKQTYEPKFTFYGCRYIRVNQFPGGLDKVKPENFTAVVLHSQMKRTGRLRSSDLLLNRLFDNIIWGQKGNFLDVPTDCPQRNERLGWTGDAQVFAKTACLNFDVEKFFTKWLGDVAADQRPNGEIGPVIPDVRPSRCASAAWGDVATIAPWQVYLAYGNRKILEDQWESMYKWVDYITSVTKVPYRWIGQERHYGDWLGLDAPAGSYLGSTRLEFIAAVYYAYSTELVIKTGKILGKDVSQYEELYAKIVEAFQEDYPTYETQTECVLAAFFRLAKDPQAAADQLAKMVTDDGIMLRTGFVGTPYLLHALSQYGYTDLAYALLLRQEYPSWLFSVRQGATTIWEHWDNIMENGEFWSTDMNSFNHYAYGSVSDWVYTVAAGIQQVEDKPGYEEVRIAPVPTKRLQWLEAELESRRGYIRSYWTEHDGFWRYDITTPVKATVVIAGKEQVVEPGSYTFYSPIV